MVPNATLYREWLGFLIAVTVFSWEIVRSARVLNCGKVENWKDFFLVSFSINVIMPAIIVPPDTDNIVVSNYVWIGRAGILMVALGLLYLIGGPIYNKARKREFCWPKSKEEWYTVFSPIFTGIMMLVSWIVLK